MSTVNSLLERAARELIDTAHTGWTSEDLLSYYHSAIAALATVRPALFARAQAFTCRAGTRQTLPSEAVTFIGVNRNQSGRVITRVAQTQLDAMDPDWINSQGATAAEAYVFDDRQPRTFWLYPGVVAGTGGDLVVSVLPDPVTLTALEQDVALPVDDSYVTPCLDWILYRAFLRDGEDAANTARAERYVQAVTQYLGLKGQAEQALTVAALPMSGAVRRAS